MLPIFDGHNDVLTREDADRFAGGRDGGHLDLPRARAGGFAGGIFAAFTPTPGYEEVVDERPDGGYDVALASPIGQDVAGAHALRTLGRLLALERDGHVRVARAAGDLDRARDAGVLAAVAHLEGAEAIDPQLEALDAFHAAGLRSVGPVWSRHNAFAHGVPFAFPSSPDTGPGLTGPGRALIARCAELGIAVDLSHLNEAGFWDVARLELAPLVASHSGAHALCPASRNLTDAQLEGSAPPEDSSGSSSRSASFVPTAATTPTRSCAPSSRTCVTSPIASGPSTSPSARTSTARRSRQRSGTWPACPD
jgi:membrane dipeptidase